MRQILFAAALTCIGVSASAETVIHTCTVNSEGTYGWIANQMVLAVPTGDGQAVISDAIVRYTVGQPVNMRLNDDKSVGTWTLTLRTNRGQNMRVRYRAEFSNNGQNIRVSVNLPTRHRETAVGTCATSVQG